MKHLQVHLEIQILKRNCGTLRQIAEQIGTADAKSNEMQLTDL
jgi:hypothetical protein